MSVAKILQLGTVTAKIPGLSGRRSRRTVAQGWTCARHRSGTGGGDRP